MQAASAPTPPHASETKRLVRYEWHVRYERLVSYKRLVIYKRLVRNKRLVINKKSREMR